MTNPTDEDELNVTPSERAEETESGEGEKRKSGKTGGASEGDADSFGRGKAGAGTTVAKLAPQKLKEVMANWRELTAQDLVDAVVEFFGESPMRASANAAVSWAKNANAKSFAVVNWVIDAGNKAVRDFTRTRDRGRDTRGLQQRRPAKGPNKPGVNMGLNGPVPSGSGN